MYFWNMEKLVEELKTEKLSKWKARLFIFASPLIHLSTLIMFATILLGHQAIEYLFKDHLQEMDASIAFYNAWAWIILSVTLAITVIGIFICRYINKHGDNKNFWQRMSLLGFSVNFHLTVYALIVLAFLGLLSYLGVMQQISWFKLSIWPNADIVQTATTRRSMVSGMFRTAGSIIFLPFVPGKIKLFLTNLRGIILMLYPVISLLPPLLTILHYTLVARLLKKMFQPYDRCEI